MLRQLFTTQQLSKFFKKANILGIVCLIAILLQNRYLPDYAILELSIELIYSISVYIIACIIISQTLLVLTKNHPKFFIQYRLIALTIGLFLATLIFWLLLMNHHILASFIEFYSEASINSHYNSSIIYLLIFILIMLIIDLYYSIMNHEKINNSTIQEHLSQSTRIFIAEYIIILTSFVGILQIKSFHEFAIIATHDIETMSYIHLKFFAYAFLALWITGVAYHLYLSCYQQKN